MLEPCRGQNATIRCENVIMLLSRLLYGTYILFLISIRQNLRRRHIIVACSIVILIVLTVLVFNLECVFDLLQVLLTPYWHSLLSCLPLSDKLSLLYFVPAHHVIKLGSLAIYAYQVLLCTACHCSAIKTLC